jgi:DNA polymerase III sliding clamp (beta) subunit (PCNA family)
MNFICDRNALVKEIILAKEDLFILVEIQLIAKKDTLFIKSTNGKDNFESKLPATVIVEGNVTLFGHSFLKILDALPEEELEFKQISSSTIAISHLQYGIIVRILLVSKDNKDDYRRRNALMKE